MKTIITPIAVTLSTVNINVADPCQRPDQGSPDLSVQFNLPLSEVLLWKK